MVKKLTENQKKVLRELVEFKCEGCGKHEDEVGKLEIHRMKRRVDGGTYIPSNIQVLCSECHKMRDFI